MSSTKSVTPLNIELKPSRRLQVLMSVLFAGALFLLLPLALSLPIKLLLTVMLIFGYLVALNRTGRFSSAMHKLPFFREPVQQLVWRQDGQWRLISKQGRIYPAQLLPSTTLNRLFVILNFRLDDMPWYQRSLSLVLLSDAVDTDQLRQLRIRLLTQGLSQPYLRPQHRS